MPTTTPDASFAKYTERGAYHWDEIGRHPIRHNAFTAERYRMVIDSASLRPGQRVLDYGCGDGALIGVLSRRSPGGVGVHGYDPNAVGLSYAESRLRARNIRATLHASTKEIPDGYFDCVVCTEVIEHASHPGDLLAEIARLLRPGGRMVVTTPIRLTERPEDPNHAQEWFPSEFRNLFDPRVWRVLSHAEVIPVAAVEAYFWRPPVFFRVPVFRLLCNLLSIYADMNALSWLRVRPRLFMMQAVVAERLSPLAADHVEHRG